MPPARKRGSQEQGQQRQASTACRCRGGCRRRQMTTPSLHGSSSFVALKKRNKKPTPSRNCKRGGGLLSLSWVQTEADDDDEPTWLVVVRCLKEKEKETHPFSQLQAGGWVIVVVVGGADGGRCRRRAYMARRRSLP